MAQSGPGLQEESICKTRTGTGSWLPPRALLATPALSESSTAFGSGQSEKRVGWEELKRSLLCKWFLSVLASPGCSDRGQEHVLSVISWGRERDPAEGAGEGEGAGRSLADFDI